MAGNVIFRDIDKGWGRLLAQVRKTAGSKPHVAVGLMGTKAAATRGDETTRDGEPLTNAELGLDHEFGLGVPERSFVRDTIDIKLRDITKTAAGLQRAVLRGALTTRNALDLLGLFVKGEIQQRIADGIPPANAPETIRRKGSSTPLIDTGQLRGAIDHEVRNA